MAPVADLPDSSALFGRLQVLAGRTYVVADLSGGLTNRNYRVTTTDAGPPGDAHPDRGQLR